jgi:hypothetical protein
MCGLVPIPHSIGDRYLYINDMVTHRRQAEVRLENTMFAKQTFRSNISMAHYPGRWCRPAPVISTACKKSFLNGCIGALTTIHPILRFKHCKPVGFGSHGLSRSEHLNAMSDSHKCNETPLSSLCDRDTETITPHFPVSRFSQNDQSRISSFRPYRQCGRSDQQNMRRHCL